MSCVLGLNDDFGYCCEVPSVSGAICVRYMHSKPNLDVPKIQSSEATSSEATVLLNQPTILPKVSSTVTNRLPANPVKFRIQDEQEKETSIKDEESRTTEDNKAKDENALKGQKDEGLMKENPIAAEQEKG